MHHKSYFEKSLISTIIVQENPKMFRDFLAKQNLKSFPNLMSAVDPLTSPECLQHEDFDTKLKKQTLLCKFKLDQDANEMNNVFEDSDHEWIFDDKQVLALFNPLKKDALSLLLVKVFTEIHANLQNKVEPFIGKTVKVVTDILQNGMLKYLILKQLC